MHRQGRSLWGSGHFAFTGRAVEVRGAMEMAVEVMGGMEIAVAAMWEMAIVGPLPRIE